MLPARSLRRGKSPYYQKRNHRTESIRNISSALTRPLPSRLRAGVKPFIQKHWKPITAAVCAAAVAAAVLVPKNSAKPAAASAQYVETRPEKRNIVNSYSADGTITAADTYTVKPMVKGTVLTADFEVGDMASSVEKAQLSLDQAQSSYDDAVDAQYIRSSVRGTVSSLKVKAGDVVSAGQEVAVVRDDSTLLLTLDFPAADAATYFVGQSVDVTIDGTFETTTGTIQSISGADSLSSGNLAVRSVVIAVQNPGTLNTTMSGTASISGVSAMSSAHFTCQYEQTIIATASGTIIAKDVKVGDTVGSSSSTTETMCVINDLSYLEMTLDVDELDILDIAVGQKAEITAGTTTGSTTTYPVTIRIDDTGSLMPGMNATAALDIPPCRRYVIVKATAGFAVFRLILKSLLFYSCLDFTQNLGKTHFCLTFGVHFSIRSLFFGIFFNVFAFGIYSFDSCFLSTAWIS